VVRINLLPTEIVEKRRFEKNIRYVVIAGALAVVLVVAAYSVLMLQVAGKRGELQDKQQLEADLRSQAEAFRVFEEKAEDLEQRKQVAERALAGRVDWGRLANELSLVLPADVWLDQLSGGETTGLSLQAYALDSPDDIPDIGHKAVAKTLIRLADLEQVRSAWLDASAKTLFQDQPAIEFSVTTGVETPGLESTQDETPAVPAPPAEAP